MTWRAITPRSLPGQMALLVALALFVAQAINFAFLLRERRQLLLAQVTGPVVARLIDAAAHPEAVPADTGRRGRVRIVAATPIDGRGEREPQVEAIVARGLAEAGLLVGAVATEVRRSMPRSGSVDDRRRRGGRELVVAVAQPRRGWLVVRMPWNGREGSLVWQLIAQTLVLYAVVLLPVLWIARRIARPLRTLADAARGFRPGDAAEPVPEQGPHDVRALVAAFNALRLRVTAMLEEKDRMLGAIGHDLRTPLAALRVRIESVEDDQDRARMVDTISDMNRMLDDILSLARLGRPSEAPTEVDLAALVDAVVEDFRDLGADVDFIESNRLTLRLRPSLIRRAVRNLIENAIKYGDGAAVRLEPDGRTVRIVVADQGPGIPPDRLEAVFDPFTRLETSRNRDTGGIGLGLALARAIVREAGGDITLGNRAGGGLDATITLPR